jgi:hypothetical protein
VGNNEQTLDANIPDFNKKCETCGAKLSDYNRKSQHCNGYWNQIYTFECGSRTRFSPNFMAFVEEQPCPKDPLIMEKNNKLKVQMDRLKKYIGNLDIEDEDKKGLRDKVDYYHRYRY